MGRHVFILPALLGALRAVDAQAPSPRMVTPTSGAQEMPEDEPFKPLFFDEAIVDQVAGLVKMGTPPDPSVDPEAFEKTMRLVQARVMLSAAERLVFEPEFSVTDKRASLLGRAVDPRNYQSMASFDWRLQEVPEEAERLRLWDHPNMYFDGHQLHKWMKDPDWVEAHQGAWVNWEGHQIRRSARESDNERVKIFAGNMTMFALAYRFTGEEQYLRKATALAERWWLDGKTGMLPSMNFAIGSRPESRRGNGIIEMKDLWMALDSVALLHETGSREGGTAPEIDPLRVTKDVRWSQSHRVHLRQWCRSYSSWLDKHSSMPRDHHGWWFVVQHAAVMRCAGKTDVALKLRMMRYVRPLLLAARGNGMLAEVMDRTKALDYHFFILKAMILIWHACIKIEALIIAELVARVAHRTIRWLILVIASMNPDWRPEGETVEYNQTVDMTWAESQRLDSVLAINDVDNIALDPRKIAMRFSVLCRWWLQAAKTHGDIGDGTGSTFKWQPLPAPCRQKHVLAFPPLQILSHSMFNATPFAGLTLP